MDEAVAWLFEAAAAGDLVTLWDLLEVNPLLVYARDTFAGETALREAAFHGQEACVQELLAAGAAVDAKDYTGTIALGHAAAGGSAACVCILLEAGASPEAASNTGCTALMKAAIGGHAACWRMLEAAGARITAVD